ncbi:hypothetical protein N9H60_03390 [Flavimaricola sp.]|nr:hypothetical protein [Flavimaricola sp.]MDA9020203.1 hypothetical protein [Flavimaricola sp.]
MILNRTAIIGRPSSWPNFWVQAAIFGGGAVVYIKQGLPFAPLVALVVGLNLAEGASRLVRTPDESDHGDE